MKGLRLFFMTALLLGGFTSRVMAQEISIINGTGFSITELILVDVGADNRTNLLDTKVLANEKELKVQITGSSEGWLLIAGDEAGTSLHLKNIDLTGVTKITLFGDGTVELK